MKKFYVYILADRLRRLVVNSADRLLDYQNKQLVYYEVFDNSAEADRRKQTIESWPERKIQFLVNLVNPAWVDWKEEIVN
jgi:hypothetical protein